MTIAIAIIGGLAVVISLLGIIAVIGAESMDGSSGALGVGFIGLFIYAIGWLCTIALYILSLCHANSVAISLTGAFGVATPILAPLSLWITRKLSIGMFIGWGCTIALFILVLAK